jgi:hypothetical protein
MALPYPANILNLVASLNGSNCWQDIYNKPIDDPERVKFLYMCASAWAAYQLATNDFADKVIGYTSQKRTEVHTISTVLLTL